MGGGTGGGAVGSMALVSSVCGLTGVGADSAAGVGADG